MPETTETPRDESSGLFEGQRFLWNGVCQCKLMTNQKLPPGFNNWRPGSKTSFEFFLQLFPIEWFKTSVVENTSDSLRAASLQPISFGKMCHFLDCGFSLPLSLAFLVVTSSRIETTMKRMHRALTVWQNTCCHIDLKTFSHTSAYASRTLQHSVTGFGKFVR